MELRVSKPSFEQLDRWVRLGSKPVGPHFREERFRDWIARAGTDDRINTAAWAHGRGPHADLKFDRSFCRAVDPIGNG